MSIKSPEDFNHKLNLLFHGMLALPLVAFVYLFLEIQHHDRQPVIADKGMILTLTIVGMIVAIVVAVYGYMLFKRGLRQVVQCETFREKLSAYLGISVKFYCFVGVSSILLVGGLYLTNSAIFIAGYVILLFLMSLNRPALQKYVQDMRLTRHQHDMILHRQPFDAEETTSPEES